MNNGLLWMPCVYLSDVPSVESLHKAPNIRMAFAPDFHMKKLAQSVFFSAFKDFNSPYCCCYTYIPN